MQLWYVDNVRRLIKAGANFFVQQKKIDEEVGFTKVMKSITEQSNQFVVVGHNMFLDLLHFYDKFYKRLPQELPEFVKETNQLFPQ
jgi:hypothetical protein